MSKIIKTLKLSDNQEYQINAVALDGMTKEELQDLIDALQSALDAKADKSVVDELLANKISVIAGPNAPLDSEGEDGDIYLISEE